MSRRARYVSFNGLLVALTLCVTAGDARAAQILPRTDLSSSLAVRPDGSATLFSLHSGEGSHSGAEVGVHRAAPGAPFAAPQTVLPFDEVGRVADAGVATDGSGVVAIERHAAPWQRVQVRTVAADGAVGPATTTCGRSATAYLLDLAVAPSGAAVVVCFQLRQGQAWDVVAAVRAPGAVEFGPPVHVLEELTRGERPVAAAAIGDRGDVVIGFGSDEYPARTTTVVRDADGSFSAPEVLGGATYGTPEVAVGDGGSAIVATVNERPVGRLRVRVARRPAGAGSMGPPRTLRLRDVGDGAPREPKVAVGPSGDVLVMAWTSQRRLGRRLTVWEAGPRAPLRRTATLGREITASGAADIGPGGRVAVAWSEDVQLLRRSPVAAERTTVAIRPRRGARFGPPQGLGGAYNTHEVTAVALVPGGALTTSYVFESEMIVPAFPAGLRAVSVGRAGG